MCVCVSLGTQREKRMRHIVICGFSECGFFFSTLSHKQHYFRGIKVTYLLTYLLTPWCRVLLENLTGLQLVKKFPAFHGTRRFITALTSDRHLSILGQPNPVHIPISHLLEVQPNIIHPFTPRSPQWSLSLRFPKQDPIGGKYY